MTQNPDWNRDEILLTLDLYLSNRSAPPGKTSKQVSDLSHLLRELHRANGGSPSDTFRNAAGVYLKMMNLRAFDPEYTQQGRVGMTRSSKLDKAIWDEFSGDAAKVRAEAQLVRDAIKLGESGVVRVLPEPEAIEAEEGGIVLKLHKRRERDRKLVKAKLESARAVGQLSCEVCSFDFKSAYGALGEGYIEVHHLNPVHLLKPGMKTRLDDLALLCANCHRMAHRRSTTVPLQELKAAYKGNHGGLVSTCDGGG